MEAASERAHFRTCSAKRDAVLRKEVREISDQRAKVGLFKVDVLFWDDICQDLAKDDDTFFRNYPQFKQGADLVSEHDKRLFDELTELLSSDGVIGFINRTNMTGFYSATPSWSRFSNSTSAGTCRNANSSRRAWKLLDRRFGQKREIICA
jgi:hypothetical protein